MSKTKRRFGKKRKFSQRKKFESFREYKQFATTTTVSASYSGERAEDYLRASILSGNTLAGRFINVRTAVKYRENLPIVDVSEDIVKARTCDFTPNGTIALTERFLQPIPLEVNLQQCKNNFLSQAYEILQMGDSANKTIPQQLADFVIASIGLEVGRSMEIKIWQGNSTTNGTNDFDGFVTKLTADANLPDAQEIAGTTVTASNVMAQLDLIYGAIPVAIRESGEARIYVSNNIFNAYKRALTAVGAAGLAGAGVGSQSTLQDFGRDEINFIDATITRANGMPANTMIGTHQENLSFGTDLESDLNDVQLLDMRENDGSNNFRYVSNFSGDVNYANVSDIATYGITNAAN